MCDKCKKNTCTGCGPTSSASVEAQLADMQDQLQTLSDAAKFLLCGHPILEMDDTDDIASFDFVTGLGFDCWEGWAICDGTSHYSASKKKMISTPNLTDRFIVAAGGTYSVGDTGGLDMVALSIAELPAHNHNVNDPGHTHIIIDPGHDHGVTDPGHTHGGSSGSHTHTFTTNADGFHEHTTGSVIIGFSGTDGAVRKDDNAGGNSTSTNGLHTHTGTTDAAGAGITVSSAFTGVDINPSYTGITNTPNTTGISTQNEGGSIAHENRPPYYALFFVKRIG